MKSGKLRRAAIMARRKKLAAKRQATAAAHEFSHTPYRFVPVNEAMLVPNNSYGAPDFVRRGYYVNRPFRCVDCSKEDVWTGTQQKWWYEVAKGFAYSTAIRCRACRRKDQERKTEARRIHLEGIARKNQARIRKGTGESS